MDSVGLGWPQACLQIQGIQETPGQQAWSIAARALAPNLAAPHVGVPGVRLQDPGAWVSPPDILMCFVFTGLRHGYERGQGLAAPQVFLTGNQG